jgi:hypothetical protein
LTAGDSKRLHLVFGAIAIAPPTPTASRALIHNRKVHPQNSIPSPNESLTTFLLHPLNGRYSDAAMIFESKSAVRKVMHGSEAMYHDFTVDAHIIVIRFQLILGDRFDGDLNIKDKK